MNVAINDMIQTGLLCVALLTFYFMLKREGRRANEEIFERKIQEVEKFNDLERRVKLLEQRVELYDDIVKNELEDIKKMLMELHNKLHEHVTTNHRNGDRL